jgi:DNA repair exonuclease SbcCD ATPase subunit
MRIAVENLGPVKGMADRTKGIDVDGVTLICGDNDRGKTYLCYALYGLYKFLQVGIKVPLHETEIQILTEKGILTLCFDEIKKRYCASLESFRDYAPTLRQRARITKYLIRLICRFIYQRPNLTLI